MRISYSIPVYSKCFLNLDSNFRYGYRHLHAAVTSVFLQKALNIQVSGLAETIYHIALGVLEFIPGIGHVVALVDKTLNHRDIRIIRLKEIDPYKQGIEQGKALKEDIHFCLEKGIKIFESAAGRNVLEKVQMLEKNIPEEYKQEMRGIADGAEISYEQVLIANTILDIASLFGCSLYAVSSLDPEVIQDRVIATNCFASQSRELCPDVDNSFWRYDVIKNGNFKPTVNACKKALEAVNYYDSVHSIVFDTNTRDVHLAVSGQYSANTSYKHLKGSDLFSDNSDQVKTAKKVVKLARNLDWPLPLLAPETVIIVRPKTDTKKSTVIIGWPGILGALSGINEDGTSIAISVVPSAKQAGIPNQFLFRKILEESTSIQDVEKIVDSHCGASPMNLVAA